MDSLPRSLKGSMRERLEGRTVPEFSETIIEFFRGRLREGRLHDFMGLDRKWGQDVPLSTRLSSYVFLGARNVDNSGQIRTTNRDKAGRFRTIRETPPFTIYPHLALFKKRMNSLPRSLKRFQNFQKQPCMCVFVYIYIHIYICAVELKTGPRFGRL